MGLNLDLTNFFKGKEVPTMVAAFFGGGSYLLAAQLLQFKTSDAIVSGVVVGLGAILFYLLLGNMSMKARQNKAFRDLSPNHVKYIKEDVLPLERSVHSVEFSPLLTLKDKGIVRQVKDDGSDHYTFVLTDWAIKKIKKDPRFHSDL